MQWLPRQLSVQANLEPGLITRLPSLRTPKALGAWWPRLLPAISPQEAAADHCREDWCLRRHAAGHLGHHGVGNV